MFITLDQANALLKSSIAKAQDIGIAVTVVVLDVAGNLKAFARMDGAWLGSVDVALKKAKTSVLFEVDTQSVWEVCKPGAQAHGIESTNGGLVSFAGGIPLKTKDGVLMGAIGVSGGQVDQDLEIARSGAQAFV